MNKNDKIIAVAGVIVLIIASIGVYTWKPSGAAENASLDSLLSVTSSFSNVPSAISVSNANPFYALIATPLAVHYDRDGNQEIIPLYVENLSNPSRAVTRAMNDQIGIPVNQIIDSTKTAEAWSVDIATTYWSHSDAALLIQNDNMGYTLGVMATPLASYLSIPVFVTNGTDARVQKALTTLGVKTTLICGENVKGSGKMIRFTDIDSIVNASMSLIQDKFGSIGYLTITNPRDAWPTEVLASTSITIGPKPMTTLSTTYLATAAMGEDTTIGSFTIPQDYKYALVKFKGTNLNPEEVNTLGDTVFFNSGPNISGLPDALQQYELYFGGTSLGGVPKRDASGNIIEDSTYNEMVLYRRNGVTYNVYATPFWLATTDGNVRVDITIEKLNDSVYPLMKGLSSLAPYLTAYHKGLLYGKPEFAFSANDDTLFLGQQCPGDALPRTNAKLVPASNAHVFWVHDQINKLLASMAKMKVEKTSDLEPLRDYYRDNSIYIALVGDATMLPQLIYNTTIETTAYDSANYYWGCGVPSDFIYSNIDPNPGDWTGKAPDLYSDNTNQYPYQENIIGRITGWDVQDASALVARTIYYDRIVNALGEWKDNAAVMCGSGNDFQKPFVRYKLFGELLGMVAWGEPMKLTTGASYFTGLGIQSRVEKLGFNTTYIRENAAGYQGFSNEAIQKMKTANLLNKLLMSPRQLRNAVGDEVVRGKTVQEASNFIFANAHGNQHLFTMGDVGVTSLGLGSPHGVIHAVLEQVASILGFGPGTSLSDQMYYNPRNVENMNLGPSFLWIESCICGKLDGIYPTQSITQAFLHAGCGAVISSSTTSNIAGGYLDTKKTMYDWPGQALSRYIQWSMKARKGIYPDMHFGDKIYTDTLNNLKPGDVSLGKAFRDARNVYLPDDDSWEVWWSPPLVYTGNPLLDQKIHNDYVKRTATTGLDPQMDNKFQSFWEYHIYGDPAFIPYIPNA
jgi:hypothetical protein